MFFKKSALTHQNKTYHSTAEILHIWKIQANKNSLGWCSPARWVIPLGFATTSSQQRMDVPLCLGAVLASKMDPKESWRTGHHVWYAWVSQASSLDRYFFWYTWSCSRKTDSMQTVSYSEMHSSAIYISCEVMDYPDDLDTTSPGANWFWGKRWGKGRGRWKTVGIKWDSSRSPILPILLNWNWPHLVQ